MYLEINNPEQFNNFIIETVQHFLFKNDNYVIIPFLTKVDYVQEALYGVYSALQKQKINIYFPCIVLDTMKMYIRYCAKQSILNLNQMFFTKKRKIDYVTDNSILEMDNFNTMTYNYSPDEEIRIKEYISEVTQRVSTDVYLSKLWILVRIFDIKKDFRKICYILNDNVPIKIGYDILSLKIKELKKICYSLIEPYKVPYYPISTRVFVISDDNENNNRKDYKKEFVESKIKRKKHIFNYFQELKELGEKNGSRDITTNT